MKTNELTERCARLEEGTSEAIDWLSSTNNKEIAGPSQLSSLNELNRIKRRTQRLKRASSRNMAVSVFGPSQAGKSFLVSVLAKPNVGPLLADFNDSGDGINYIRDINPEGEGESTGLVTRFTRNKSDTPKNFPIRLSVFSESDVIRVLCNSFYMDGDQSALVDSERDIEGHIKKFESNAIELTPGLTAEDVRDVQEYVEKRFGKFTYAAQFKGYWERFAEIAPRLSRYDRINFFSILWNECKEFTELYERLAKTLDSIGHTEFVYAKQDSLIPKADSIIDVKTLHKLYGESNQPNLEVQTLNGTRINIERPMLCALTAELEIPMKSLSHEIFEFTDLLDFPGARNRFSKPLDQIFKNGPKPMSELFLRGKVAYLFDNYVSFQEVTSMLLCIPDGNMDTTDLPGLVDGWISDTIGTDPSKRANSYNGLFFVLTKFDTLLVDHAGATGSTERFNRRIEASLREKFGKLTDRWVDEWGINTPFQNCFWLRNPSYPIEGIIEYNGENKEEIRIRDEKTGWITELSNIHNDSSLVKKHFVDPQKAWEWALTLNDGGVSLLLQEMMNVCKKDIKSDHINNQLTELSRNAIGVLPKPPGETLDERIQQTKMNVKKIQLELNKIYKENKFGAFIGKLSISQDLIRSAISHMPIDLKKEIENNRSGDNDLPPDLILPGLNDDNPTSQETLSEVKSTSPQDVYIAQMAVQTWLDHLHKFSRNESNVFSMDSEVVILLIAELESAAVRLNIVEKIATYLEKSRSGMFWDSQIPIASIICNEFINRFVSNLGIDDLPIEKRPKITNSETPIFSETESKNSVSELPENPKSTQYEFCMNWITGLSFVAENNAKSVSGDDSHAEQYDNLRQVIQKLTEVQSK